MLKAEGHPHQEKLTLSLNAAFELLSIILLISLQLNVDRATQRRAPESMMSLNQEFDESKFHFGKVRDGEILMELREKDNRSASKDLLIINVSVCDTIFMYMHDQDNPLSLLAQWFRINQWVP